MTNESIELTILMPCLNEELTLATCINKANAFLEEHQISGEIVIGDNGSTDNSIAIAESLGARVARIPQKGYGSALIGGINAARGTYIIMGDSDDSYDFSKLMPYVEKLREGYDLVMGNRFKGGIGEGAMPLLHRYLGNPVLSFIGRLFFDTNIKDFHCGLRGFNRERMLSIDLECTGMEFASEMVVKSILNDFKIAEVPTTLSKDGRDRPPHLNTWRDGWRHLRFLLLYSPAWLFLYPGLFLFVVGLLVTITLLIKPVQLLGVELDIHTLVYSGASIFVGFQLLFFFVFSRTYASLNGLLPKGKLHHVYQKSFSLEKGLVMGAILLLAGFVLTIMAWSNWSATGFGDLDPRRTLRLVLPSVFLIIGGIQIAQSSFLLSILELKKRPH